MKNRILEIVLASSNRGKACEIRNILRNSNINIIPQSEFRISDVEETGLTFVENAILKARHATKISGLPAMADDSGLVVDALQGAPGIRSARYAGENKTDLDRIHKLLAELEKTGSTNRHACFHCVVALMLNEKEPAPFISHGIWAGEILKAPRGSHGFGYDPIFYVPTHHCSAAELPESEKNTISHRAQALAKLMMFLRNSC